jgi:hypothetical protein
MRPKVAIRRFGMGKVMVKNSLYENYLAISNAFGGRDDRLTAGIDATET